MDQQRSRGRRIHVEGADPAWAKRRPPLLAASGELSRRLAEPAAPGLVEQADVQRLMKNMAEIRARIVGLRSRVHALDEGLRRIAADECAAAEHRVEQARARLDARTVLERRRLAEVHAGQTARLQSDIRERIATLAPGLASAELNSSESPPTAGIPGRYLRFGHVRATDPLVPVLAPFFGTAGWYLEGPRAATDSLVRDTVARIVGQAPLKRLALNVFDPRARGVLGQFAPLRQLIGTAFPVPTSDPAEFSSRLGSALKRSTAESESIVSAGYSDLFDQWSSAAVPEGTLSLAVVLDYPFGVSDELREHLIRIAATEGPVRLSLLIGADSAASTAAASHAIPGMLTMLRADTDSWGTDLYPPHIPVVVDQPASDRTIVDIVSTAVELAKRDQGVSFPIEQLLGADISAPWQHTSAESLETVIGRLGRGELTFRLRTENPPLPNALIGGAVGTGKSNLLLDIIYGLATRYAPDQLELHLLDFKQGVEFARFAPDADGENWLPHVRTLGLEADRSFGLAVLRHLTKELDRRSAAFKREGASSLDEYRSRTGHTLARCLLIVDEFHMLFTGDDDHVERAVAAFEQLARQGRSYGIHLLMASQTPSGVAGLAAKGESIFAQFPIRISLKNTAAESQAILSPGNKAAAELSYRGEIVFNSNLGSAEDSGNQRGIVAYAEPAAMAELQRRLWSLGHADPPLIFNGAESSGWPSVQPPLIQDGLPVWLGRPIEVGDKPRTHVITEDADQAVALVGQADLARNALRTMVLSCLPRLAGGRIVLLDGDGEVADELADELGRESAAEAVGFQRLDRRTAAQWIRADLGTRVRAAEEPREETGPLLVLGLSLQRLRDMDQADVPEEDEYGLIADDTPTGSARSVLAELAHEGAKNGVFFIGSWNNLRTLGDDLGGFSAGVALYVTCNLGLEDLRSIAGHSVRAVEGQPRLGVFDRNGDGKLEVVIPYDPASRPQRARP